MVKKQDKNPELSAKYICIPIHIWKDPNLSKLEVTLLAQIYHLDKNDKGCFATNHYLAESVGLSESRVANVLTELRKKDMIKTIRFDGRRRFLQVTSKYLLQPSQVPESREGRIPGSREGCRNTTYYSRGKKKRRGRSLETSPSGSHFRVTPAWIEPKNLFGDRPKLTSGQKMTIKLLKAIKEDGYVQDNTKPELWPSEFTKCIHQYGRKKVKRVFRWYIDHIGISFVPQAFSGGSFRKKFAGILAAMKKSQKDPDKYKRPSIIEEVCIGEDEVTNHPFDDDGEEDDE